MSEQAGYPIKLVRDRTPEAVNPSGEPGDLYYGPAPDPATHAGLLRKKLGEEVTEYLVEGRLGELVDVLAVVEALAGVWHECSLERLIRLLHQDPRGGFVQGVIMYGYHPEHDSEAPVGSRAY